MLIGFSPTGVFCRSLIRDVTAIAEHLEIRDSL